MANENDGAVASAIQRALYRRDIILQRGQWVLYCNGVETVSVEPRNDLAPTGTVGPQAMGENDSRLCGYGHLTLL
jgi:hypothetical protein